MYAVIVQQVKKYKMATQSTYYLDAPSFSSATIIYTDVDLTTVAPDGFYSDGTNVREQVSGVLLPQVACPGCATPCGGSIGASGAQGIYYLSTDLGTDTGAVIVTFDPYSVPDGILAVFDSVSYNGLSSPTYGWLQGSAGLPTYIGQTAGDCGIVAGSPYTLNEFEFNGTTFAPLGTTTSVAVSSGQMDLTVGGPGNCVMVIPKTTATPSVLDLQFIGPCSGTAFEIGVSCPAALPSFASSAMTANSTLVCAATVNQTYHVAYVTGSAGTLGLYDLVFTDQNGQFKLSAGYYKTTAAGSNDWFQVDSNGVIVAFGTCSGVPVAYTIDNSATGTSAEACDGATTTSTVYAEPGNTVPIVGMILYDSTALTTPFVGSTGWRKLTRDGINYAVEINTSGEITNYITCSSAVAVTSVSGYMEPCIGGTIDDHMGAAVVLDTTVSVDTTFLVQVTYAIPPGVCYGGGTTYTQSFSVEVLAGDSGSYFNACTNGYYIASGANICSACILSCDNPAVDLTGFSC